MSPRRNRGARPPKVMTWGKAALVLALAVIFDALRIFFNFFWFFGPAFAAMYCTAKAGAVVGMTIGGFFCGVGAGAVGFFGFGPLAAFGAVMAMSVGLAGWMTVGFLLIATNARIFKENPTNTLIFVSSLGIAEIPFIGALPSITFATWKMYHSQIAQEKAALAQYEKERAAEQARERNQQAAALMQARVAQVAHAEQQAANDTQYAEEIPEEVRKAA